MRSREQAVVVGERRIGRARRSSSRPRPASATMATRRSPAATRGLPRPSAAPTPSSSDLHGWTRAREPGAPKGAAIRFGRRGAGGSQRDMLAGLELSLEVWQSSRSRDEARPHLLLGALRRGKRGCPGCARCGALQGALGRDRQSAAPAARGGQGPAHHPLDRHGGSGRSAGEAVAAIRAAGDPPLAVLHCLSAYPAPVGEGSISAPWASLASRFGCPVGFSDHTLGIEIAVAAAAARRGHHRSISRSTRPCPGPDHRASLDPRSSAPW